MNTMDGITSNFKLMEPASPQALIPDCGLWPWWAAAALTALVVGVLAWLLRKKKSAANLLTIRNAAFIEAGTALAHVTTLDVRDAAVLSSLILRKYLSVAAGDPALYETHEEFVLRHDALQALATEVRTTTAAGFARLAALKYAPEIPAVEASDVIAQSRALLETLHTGFVA
jgi:hypothetical protein